MLKYKKLLVLIGLIEMLKSINAQSGTNSNYCWNNANTITTNWAAPNSLNTWNWTLPGNVHPVYLEYTRDTPNFYIELPYFCSLPPNTGFCNQENTFPYDLIWSAQLPQDIYPENGWELIMKNFGTGNASGQTTGIGVGSPHFVLYNKFTGRLKVFIAQIDTEIANSAFVKISFIEGENKSTSIRALFAPAEAISQPLAVFNNQAKFQAPNKYSDLDNARLYSWMVADIETAYDPCTCIPDKPSLIQAELSLENITTLTATSDGVTETGIYENGQFQAQQPASISFGSTLKAAGKGYSDWSSYANYANSFIGGLDEKRKNKIVDAWWKQMYPNDYLVYGSLTPQQRQTQYSTWLGQGNNSQYSLGLKNAWGITKNIASNIPYVGIAAGVIDHLTGGDKTAPSVMHTRTTITGDLTTSHLEQSFKFLTPGSSSTNLGGVQWNNILGVFNLLKAPNMEYGQLNNDWQTIGYSDDEWNVSHSPEYNSITNQHIKQYRLSEDPKFIINPHSEMEVISIDACFVLEYTYDLQYEASFPGTYSGAYIPTQHLRVLSPEDYDNRAAIPYHDNMGCTSPSFGSCFSLEDRIDEIEKTGLDLEYISPDIEEKGGIIRFRTKYVPLQQLRNINFMLFGANPPKTYMKMFVTLKHKTNPSINNVSIYTYDITQSVTNAIFSGQSKSIACRVNAFNTGIPIINAWVYLNDPTYRYWQIQTATTATDPNPTRGLPFANPFYTDRGDITVAGITYPPTSGHIVFSTTNSSGITVPLPSNSTYIAYKGFTIPEGLQYGQNVTLISGVPVDFPNGVFPPGLTVIINPNIAELLFGAEPTRPISVCKATDEEINTICTSQDYLDNIVPPNRPASQVEVPVVVSENNLSAAPNPFEDALVLTMNLVTDSEVYVMAYDMVGHLVEAIQVPTAFAAGEYKLIWNASNLPAGLYFVTLQGNDFRKTIKVIKQ